MIDINLGVVDYFTLKRNRYWFFERNKFQYARTECSYRPPPSQNCICDNFKNWCKTIFSYFLDWFNMNSHSIKIENLQLKKDICISFGLNLQWMVFDDLNKTEKTKQNKKQTTKTNPRILFGHEDVFPGASCLG